MRKLLFVYLVAAFSTALAQAPVEKEPLTEPLAADTLATAGLLSTPVPKVKWAALDTLLNNSTDTTYIINFWATWCRPCVAELPHFEQIREDYGRHKVRVLLVSMDFAKDIEDRVIPFVNKMKLKNTVWLLNEPDANSWIERVDASWSGALPATLIINSARPRRMFFEKALDYETLARELSYFIEY
ncbi:TlpA disulfide reductase family protein [Telluribacter humicola]|uniref:TlpA disulfide reductase family protein n=1 Tax=Telluribacter humicola TaxID=1720261 RepID=UPI001A978D0F|nr:TlpA disulfide reductase family protein [Telluribacter humicola]